VMSVEETLPEGMLVHRICRWSLSCTTAINEASCGRLVTRAVLMDLEPMHGTSASVESLLPVAYDNSHH
jgi:hypothetical protein